MKFKNDIPDHKTRKRIEKVIDFLDQNCEDSCSETTESQSTCWNLHDVDHDCCCARNHTRLRKKKNVNKLLEPVLGNDIYRWSEKGVFKRFQNSEGNAFRPDNLFDKMDDEFLPLFDHDVAYEINMEENKKKKKVYRRRYPNEYTLDPQEIKEELHDMRDSVFDRLKVFEENRATKQFRQLTEGERQVVIRHIRTEKAKKDFMHKMEWYILKKLADQRIRIREAEKLKYEKKVEDFLTKIPQLEIERWTEIKEEAQRVLKKESKKAELMKNAILTEELLTTVDFTETEVKHKFEKFLMKLKLSEMAEMYQLDMDQYCKFWKKKALLLQTERREENEATKKERKLCNMQRKLEQLDTIEKYWKKEATFELNGITQSVREAVSLIPAKEKELMALREQNEELENKIGHWKKILPEYMDQVEKFVLFSFQEVPERKDLLECLKKLKEFNEPTPPVVACSSTDASSTDNVPLQEEETINAQKKQTVIKEYDFDMSLGHLYLSDGDFEEMANKLLQIKFIIVDILRRVLPSEKSEGTNNEKNVKQESSLSSEDQCQSFSSSSDNSSKLQTVPKLSEKLEKIVAVIDETFEIVGIKFSSPDLQSTRAFIDKRTKSVKKIINRGTN